MENVTLPPEVAWINNKVLRKDLIFEETFPLMKSHFRFDQLIANYNKNEKVKNGLTDDELEEFKFMKNDVKKSLEKKDYRFIKLESFIRLYFVPELLQIGVEHSTRPQFIRNLMNKNFNDNRFNKAYKSAINKLFT